MLNKYVNFVSIINPFFTGEEFMVSEKTIREKFLILWKYIYPCFLHLPWCFFGRHELLLNNLIFLIISGNLSLNLLAGYVQFDVQPNDLLRHEQ